MLAGYLKAAVPFVLLRRPIPFVLGLAITDRCNLACRHCRLANAGPRAMTYAEIEACLRSCSARGYRELYLTGGEPLLWRDGRRETEDVVRLARGIGYHHVHIYTNGTQPLESSATALWIGMDGLAETYERIRHYPFDRVVAHIRQSSHPRIAIVYTINNLNKGEIAAFLRFARELNVLGVAFYFHTPYYGRDELFIPAEERSEIIERLIRYQRAGLPVLNSYAGLRLVQSGQWPRPNDTWMIVDSDGEHPCCRGRSPDVCPDCGYTTCAEIVAVQRLAPSALRMCMRFL